MKLKSSELKMYSTKLTPETHDLITVLPQVMPKGTGQRELLEDMLLIYEQAYPKRLQAARQLLMIREAQNETPQPVFIQREDEQAAVQEIAEKLVPTLRFVGKPKVHLVEDGLPACKTHGEIDQGSLAELPPSAVNCGKCRYSRRTVFE